MKKIRKNDEVIVIAGKDKGKKGKVLRVIYDNIKTKVLVEKINLVKKHTKADPSKNITGGILEKAMPIDISNIAIYNQETNKPDRVGIKIEENGNKIRFFKSTGKIIELRSN